MGFRLRWRQNGNGKDTRRSRHTWRDRHGLWACQSSQSVGGRGSNEKSDAEKSLEQKQRELEQKELEIANKEKSYKLKDKLTEKGLSPELAKYLNASDDLDKFVDELSGTFNNLLVNNGFKPSDHKKSEGITKEQFAKMNYMERAKLQDEKPELYKILSQR